MVDEMFECPLLGRLIPEGLCVDILLIPGSTVEIQNYSRDVVIATCNSCVYGQE